MEITREVGAKGQVVIPIDIRRMLNLRSGSKVVFSIENNEVKVKQKKDNKEWLEEYFSSARKGKEITLEDIKKIEEESYDLP